MAHATRSSSSAPMNATASPTAWRSARREHTLTRAGARPGTPDLYSDIPISIIPPHRQRKNIRKNIVSNMNVAGALSATNLV